MAKIDKVEEEKGELAGEFMRAFIEGQFRRRGIPIDLKSRGERELEARQSKLAAVQLEKLETTNNVNETLGFFLDNAQATIGDVFGGDDKRTFEEFLGTKLDPSIAQRPKDFINISQQLFRLSKEMFGGDGLKQFDLKNSDLLLSEFTEPFAKKTAGQRGGDRLAEQTKAQRNTEENIEFQQELQAGEGPVAEALTQRLKGVGDSIGQDIIPGGLDDDFDEARGSAGVAISVLDFYKQHQSLGPELLVGVLIGDVGKSVGKFLEGGEVEVDPDGRRILRIAGGDFGNDPQAISNSIALIDEISSITGKPRTELLQIMGLEFDDFDEGEVQQARLTLFGRNE